jgi:hypothetical protein
LENRETIQFSKSGHFKETVIKESSEHYARIILKYQSVVLLSKPYADRIMRAIIHTFFFFGDSGLAM